MGVRSTTVWVVLAAASAAAADPPHGDDARAVALFDEGRELMKAGEVAKACERFDRSYKIEYTVGTALNLGDCLEKLGQVRAAYQMFADTEAMERAHGGRRAGYAHDRATALATKLGAVAVHIADPDLVGMTVTIDGQAVHPTAEFHDLFEPGVVEVVVSAPGHVEFRASANAVANKTVEVAVPELAAVAAPRVEPAKPAKPAQPARPVPPPTIESIAPVPVLPP
ncbi:MAG TPA: hypothetical protein VMJ10_27150, partial [Kofleriaceae bacterium]|nr:hypothetical protein [Kofleriaceae bacterium]